MRRRHEANAAATGNYPNRGNDRPHDNHGVQVRLRALERPEAEEGEKREGKGVSMTHPSPTLALDILAANLAQYVLTANQLESEPATLYPDGKERAQWCRESATILEAAIERMKKGPKHE